MRLPLLLLAALCAAAVAAAPAAAATTVTTAGSQLVVAAMPGVDNHVTIEPGATPATVRVGDTADLVDDQLDLACVVGVPGTVDCAASSAQVGLGDGNDTLAAATATVPLTVDAGDGNDVVRVDDDVADTVVCGNGADDASAADAQDALTGCEETPATAGAPETTIPTHPLGLTRQTTAAFAFGATESATFECALDGARTPRAAPRRATTTWPTAATRCSSAPSTRSATSTPPPRRGRGPSTPSPRPRRSPPPRAR